MTTRAQILIQTRDSAGDCWRPTVLPQIPDHAVVGGITRLIGPGGPGPQLRITNGLPFQVIPAELKRCVMSTIIAALAPDTLPARTRKHRTAR